MASELDVLLDKMEAPALKVDPGRELGLLRSRGPVGFVFEEYLPERVGLPEQTVRRGTRAVLRGHDGNHLEEAKFKLRALASYAGQPGNRFFRIESVAKEGHKLRSLDLQDEKVRHVRVFEGGKVTAHYESGEARDYL